MDIPKGYKQTEVGVIPDDWKVALINDIANVKGGGTPSSFNSSFWNGSINWFTPTEIGKSKYVNESKRKITNEGYLSSSTNLLPIGSILITSRAGIGDTAITKKEACTNQGFQSLIVFSDYDSEYIYYLINTSTFQNLLLKNASGSTFLEISPKKLKQIKIPLPFTKAEQTAIAEVLSDTDDLITTLEKLIVKKQNIKQGAMQILLTPKEDWEVKKLGEVCDVLDNLRVPLNEGQRTKMKGEIPYCGANGIVDYVNDYVVNDDILLMAEDGGYFDEYQTRPIAYRMSGKCWVNNHAHILKSKKWICQNFIYYSIVHKNILDYINSGTRAKLNKSDLVSIQISLPKTKEEQTRIATILSDMDKEIKGLKTKLEKTKMIKQGMMQELLTGRTRLV